MRQKTIQMGTDYQNMMTIREVAELLGVKDLETAIRWLRQRGITIHQMGRPKVFAVHIDLAFDTLLARDLQQRYPSSWERIYKLMAKSDAVYQLVVAELKKEMPCDTPPIQAEPKTDEEKQLLKKLLKK